MKRRILPLSMLLLVFAMNNCSKDETTNPIVSQITDAQLETDMKSEIEIDEISVDITDLALDGGEDNKVSRSAIDGDTSTSSDIQTDSSPASEPVNEPVKHEDNTSSSGTTTSSSGEPVKEMNAEPDSGSGSTDGSAPSTGTNTTSEPVKETTVEPDKGSVTNEGTVTITNDGTTTTTNTTKVDDGATTSNGNTSTTTSESYSSAQCGAPQKEYYEEGGVHYVKVTRDFGDGCQRDGVTLKGKIIAKMTFDKATQEPSKKRTITFEDFYHNGRKVEGSISAEEKLTDGMKPTRSTTQSLMVTLLNGKTYKRDATITRMQAVGYDTKDDNSDDEITTEGNWTTTFADGSTNVAKITKTLVRKMKCNMKMRVEGTIEFNRRNGTTGTIDFGDGSCDKKFTISRNGKTREVDRS